MLYKIIRYSLFYKSKLYTVGSEIDLPESVASTLDNIEPLQNSITDNRSLTTDHQSPELVEGTDNRTPITKTPITDNPSLSAVEGKTKRSRKTKTSSV